MSKLSSIQEELSHNFDTNIFRIGFITDSIWSPSGDSMEVDGSHPPFKLNNTYFIRQIFNYLNFNKPVFRSITHASWTHIGSSEINAVFPEDNAYDKIRLIDEDADNSIIQITGHSTVVFWFEGGEATKTIDTGTAVIEVSTNGVDYINPSASALYGRKQVGRTTDTLGYDNPIDELATNLVFPTDIYRADVDNNYVSYREIQYNNLVPATTYYFKIKRKASTNGIRLGGCYYFTGKTCLIYNFSKPGANQNTLISSLYNTIGQNNFNMVLVQSTVYHDFFAPSTVYDMYYDLIANIKRYVQRIVLCSCTPGGVVVVDSETELGDEEPAYVAGQNFVKEFNHRYMWNITEPLYANYPARDAVYQVTISGTNYQLKSVVPKCAAENYATWYYRTRLGFYLETTFPVGSISYPATFTKISGDGAASFTLNSLAYYPPPMNVDRDIVQSIADRMGLKFIDFYQLFANLAMTNGETIETDAYEIEEGSPLYAEYPDGYENYLSRYFDPNHWRFAANSPVYNKLISEIFSNFEFE
jgi:hypothetical protein